MITRLIGSIRIDCETDWLKLLRRRTESASVAGSPSSRWRGRYCRGRELVEDGRTPSERLPHWRTAQQRTQRTNPEGRRKAKCQDIACACVRACVRACVCLSVWLSLCLSGCLIVQTHLVDISDVGVDRQQDAVGGREFSNTSAALYVLRREHALQFQHQRHETAMSATGARPSFTRS